jgi:hypothetical protein
MENNDDIPTTDTTEIKRIICVSFKSEAEAEADGYRKARNCPR